MVDSTEGLKERERVAAEFQSSSYLLSGFSKCWPEPPELFYQRGMSELKSDMGVDDNVRNVASVATHLMTNTA